MTFRWLNIIFTMLVVFSLSLFSETFAEEKVESFKAKLGYGMYVWTEKEYLFFIKIKGKSDELFYLDKGDWDKVAQNWEITWFSGDRLFFEPIGDHFYYVTNLDRNCTVIVTDFDPWRRPPDPVDDRWGETTPW